MSERTIQSGSVAFKAGWSILFLISMLGVISQLVLIFIEPGLIDSFVAWATFLLYSVFVLLVPYRRGERWAWAITWILVVPMTVLGLNDAEAAPYFWSAGGLVAASQLLTLGTFFSES